MTKFDNIIFVKKNGEMMEHTFIINAEEEKKKKKKRLFVQQFFLLCFKALDGTPPNHIKKLFFSSAKCFINNCKIHAK